MGKKTKPELFGLLPSERIVRIDFPRPAPTLVEAFLELPDMAGLVSRAMDRLGFSGSIPAHVLPPLLNNQRVVGPAVTVRNVPARSVPLKGWQEQMETQLGEREAYYIAQPGDVIVIDSGGRYLSSNLGPISAQMAMSQGIIGAVIDGPVTGPAGIREQGFPVWCRGGTTITGHYRVDTVEINGVIACSNVQVRPGDLIVADDSGISVVPAESLDLVLETSQSLARKGRRLTQKIAEGRSASEAREAVRQLMRTDPGAA